MRNAVEPGLAQMKFELRRPRFRSSTGQRRVPEGGTVFERVVHADRRTVGHDIHEQVPQQEPLDRFANGMDRRVAG